MTDQNLKPCYVNEYVTVEEAKVRIINLCNLFFGVAFFLRTCTTPEMISNSLVSLLL